MFQSAQTSASHAHRMPFAFHNTTFGRTWDLGCSCGRATCIITAPVPSPRLPSAFTKSVPALGESATLKPRTHPSRGDLKRLTKRQQMRSTGALRLAPPPASQVQVYMRKPLPPTPQTAVPVEEIEDRAVATAVPIAMLSVAKLVKARVVSIGPVPPRLRRAQKTADVSHVVAVAPSAEQIEIYSDRSLPPTPTCSSVYLIRETESSTRRSLMTPILSGIQETPVEMYGPHHANHSSQLTPDGVYRRSAQDISMLQPASPIHESSESAAGDCVGLERSDQGRRIKKRTSSLRKWVCFFGGRLSVVMGGQRWGLDMH